MAEQYKEYVCTLTEASLKKARAELNEDPADTMNTVEAFRNLIKTRAPHIRCSMGKCVCVQTKLKVSMMQSNKVQCKTTILMFSTRDWVLAEISQSCQVQSTGGLKEIREIPGFI